MSTASTSSPTERSPPLSSSTIRRRVGSARTWKTSATTTYYCSDICRVNDITSAGDALQLAEIRQRLGDFGRQPVGVLTAQVHHLLGDAELVIPARGLDQLVLVVLLHAELDRFADLVWIPADLAARVLEFRDQLLHRVHVAARDVPHVRVPSDQAQRRRARRADPERRVGLLDGLRVRDRVLHLVVAAVEVRALLGE